MAKVLPFFCSSFFHLETANCPSRVCVYNYNYNNTEYILYPILVILFIILVIHTLDDQISESIVNLILVIILVMMAFFYFRILFGVYIILATAIIIVFFLLSTIFGGNPAPLTATNSPARWSIGD